MPLINDITVRICTNISSTENSRRFVLNVAILHWVANDDEAALVHIIANSKVTQFSCNMRLLAKTSPRWENISFILHE